MTRIAAILLVLFTLGITPTLHAQPDSVSPYLYYYSQLLGGLIIERADGTDSRQIAADVIPPNLSGLSGPGWSPSGKYFAAQGINISDSGGIVSTSYVIDPKGNNVIQWVYQVQGTAFMQWSPTGEDILLIQGTPIPNQSPGSDTFVWIIDVEKRQLLVDFGTYLRGFSYQKSEYIWDTTHQQITFYYALEQENGLNNYRVTMRFDGTTLREPVPALSFTPLDPFADSDEMDVYLGNKTSPSGHYEVSDSFTLTDTRTKKSVQLPHHTEGTSCHDYRWSKDENYIIILSGINLAGGGCSGAVLGITDSQGKFWREIGGCVFSALACADWLPPQVDVNSLPVGASKPVQVDPLNIEYDNLQLVSMIDPTKVRALEFRCIDYTTADIHDPKTHELVYSLSGMPCPYDYQASGADRVGIPIVAAADPVHHLLATYAEGATGVLIWKLNGHQYEPFLKLNTQGYRLEFTDHGERLHARNFAGWKIYSVADILAAATKSHE